MYPEGWLPRQEEHDQDETYEQSRAEEDPQPELAARPGLRVVRRE
jgi:hypothetical protein